MGSSVRLATVVTLVTMKLIIVSVAALLLGAAGPAAGAPQLPPGINAAACPNYPFCGPSPQAAPGAVPGLAAHAAAEAAVRAQQAQGVGVVGPSGNIGPSGQVGASGNISPSGLCGPTGCI